MNWILSHRLHVAMVGVAMIVASFWLSPGGILRYSLLASGVVLILSVLALLLLVAVSSPGGERTVDGSDEPTPPPLPDNRVEAFHLAWDSEAYPAWPVAEVLASMSHTAYLPPVEAKPYFATLGFDQIENVVSGSMVGYVVSIGDVTVVVFRGTDDKLDWLVNLDEARNVTPHGEIHRGFHSAYESLKQQLVALLAQRKPKHLWVTGHSLGGGLAVVCAYDLIENEKRELDGIITFGQPMVACKQLAAYLDKLLFGRYAHFVNEADIVPRVPPPPFAHCGSLVWFTEATIQRSKRKKLALAAAAAGASLPTQEDVLPQASEEEFEQMKAALREKNEQRDRLPKGTRMFGQNLPWIQDHGMNFYLDKIRNLFRKTEST